MVGNVSVFRTYFQHEEKQYFQQYTVLHEISVSVPGATKLVLIIWICWYSVYHFVSLNMHHTSKT